jgi:metallo-beta-lactamase class B
MRALRRQINFSRNTHKDDSVSKSGWIGAVLFVVLLLIVVTGFFTIWGRYQVPGRTTEGGTRSLSKSGQVAPGIYVLNDLGPAAAYVVETSEGLVLVDSGLEPTGSAIARDFRFRSLDLSRLRAILLTHAHADHSQGAKALRQLTGAKVLAGKNDATVLRAGEPRDAFCSTFDMPDTRVHSTPVDRELDDNDYIDVGDTRFHVIGAPGHTPGSICYALVRDGLHILFGGDVVMTLTEGAWPYRRMLGTYAAYLAPRYRGNAEEFLTTIRKLQEMPVPDVVLPGHPRESGNFRMTPTQWRSMLQQGMVDMETLLARYRKDGRNFLDGVPKKLLPDLYYLGEIYGISMYCLSTPSGVFLFNAPGGSDLVPFLEVALQHLGILPPGTNPQDKRSKGESMKIKAVLLTSCDREVISGLSELVSKTGCRVGVAESGWQEVKKALPIGSQLIHLGDLEQAGWFHVQAFPLEGPEAGATAYLCELGDKNVLISGRIPIKSARTVEEALLKEFSASSNASHQYKESLQSFQKINPDVWLPLVSSDDQNANLYDDDWSEILRFNETFVDRVTPIR